MKHYEGVATLKTVPLLLTLTLIMPIFLSSCKSPDKNSHGLNDVLTSPNPSGLKQVLKQRKALYEELLEETSGSTK